MVDNEEFLHYILKCVSECTQTHTISGNYTEHKDDNIYYIFIWMEVFTQTMTSGMNIYSFNIKTKSEEFEKIQKR